MPLLKEVQSLYFQCLNYVFENLFEELISGVSPQNFDRMRKYYVSHLHGKIRDHILKLAVLKKRNRIKFLLQLINLLADPAVSYLCTVSGPGFLLPDHYSTLISHLNKRECIGLKTLYIRVSYDCLNFEEKDSVMRTNSTFRSLLQKGLAKNLTVLVLGMCCDNQILRIIGQHCTNLIKLDIVASWAVNDDGFKCLCLKNPNNIQKISEGERHSPQLIEQFMKIKEDCLNPCCFTLTDIRILRTNTTDVTVFMLLIFVKNLGFLYVRSIGDNLVYLSRLSYGRLKLNFNELFDTHLTDSKLKELSIVVPHLKAIHTYCIYIRPLLTHFEKLEDITVDFNHRLFETENFFNFLSVSGHRLKRITVIDYESGTDMLRIFELCPNLVEINGSVVVHDSQRKMIIPNLKKANLEFIKADTISWLLMNAPNLECLQVDSIKCSANYTDVERSHFDNRCMKKIINYKPACFDTLKYFIVHAPYTRRTFNKKTVLNFILKCKKLQLVGDLATWSVSHKHSIFIKNQLKRRNLNVDVLYADEYSLDITMQNIEDFKAM